MADLKADFNNRFLNNEKIDLFSTLDGKKYNSKVCEYFFFFNYRKIRSENSKILLLCDSSIESYILSFFLILSPCKCFFISENFDKKRIRQIALDFKIDYLISLNSKDIEPLNNLNSLEIIEVFSINEFLK